MSVAENKWIKEREFNIPHFQLYQDSNLWRDKLNDEDIHVSLLAGCEPQLKQDTRIVQKVLQMLGFHRYKRLILAKFVMLE